eukprot:TRINITY_DN11388_c0_g1_i4.p7 TRINITY_DN11388_c0_g1~~TRINITY_DN11388_c0_g1_i4.p7  ORF type:complete len:108 (-),score=3.32 TRINITY_DN11388_c0_g1_i4:1250-1573(-)
MRDSHHNITVTIQKYYSKELYQDKTKEMTKVFSELYYNYYQQFTFRAEQNLVQKNQQLYMQKTLVQIINPTMIFNIAQTVEKVQVTKFLFIAINIDIEKYVERFELL